MQRRPVPPPSPPARRPRLLAALALATLLAGSGGCYPSLRYRLEKRPHTAAETIAALTVASGHEPLEGNQVDLLENGAGSFPAMLEAIRGARSSVHFETFIFHDSEIGRQFVEALAERARAGVQVRLLLDAIGSASFGEENRRTLERAGAHVVFFQPLELARLPRLHLRTHRKVLIVDGSVAFTGGICIDDAWQGNADRPDHWRDTQVRVAGPVVRHMQTAFLRSWFESTGELLTERALFPRLPETGDMLCQLVDVSPSSPVHTARLLFLVAIDGAERSLDITNSYFVPDHAILRALEKAARRGVRVRLLLPGPRTDAGAVRWAGRTYYGRLLEAGVEIHEYMPARLHAKTFVVDSRWASVGSTNLDRRSLAWNYESNLNVFDAGFVAAMEAMFARDLARARQLSLAQWKARPLHERFREWLYGLPRWQY